MSDPTHGWYQAARKVTGDGLRKLDWAPDSHGANIWLAYHSFAGADFACFDGWPLDSDVMGDGPLGCQRFDRTCHVQAADIGNGRTPDDGEDERVADLADAIWLALAKDRR
jgi:hypothetical protein